MKNRIQDMTGLPDLAGHGEGTGPMRNRRPEYRDFLPPCNQACPAGENIQAWLSLAQAGDFEAAWRQLMEDNPLPSVTGRVCYHPCEGGCNRALTDSAVSIHSVERYLGDLALAEGWRLPKVDKITGKRVLIIGAGPSGLSAAYHLCRMGHYVEIREAGPVAGGMLHFGIPAYRLPREVLEKEVARMGAMGVRMVFNHKTTDITAEMELGGFDAVFIAVGAHLSKKTEIPGREAGRILDALSLLRSVEQGKPLQLGKRVAIYGGGNTAMDAARTVQRMSGHEALIIYRRDREHMAAHDFEAGEALEEGVKINWLRTIRDMDETGITVEVMRLEDGQPVPTGETERLEADALILALGQEADTGFLKDVPGISFKEDGTVIVGKDMMTGAPGIFAGGDMVPGERTVSVAIGHGKKAARNINAWLSGVVEKTTAKHAVIGAEGLHFWYRTEAPRTEQTMLAPEQRLRGFDEVQSGLSRDEALFEARRCLSCGNCFECDGCFAACPEKAITRLGKGNRYSIDYNKCTGCAACYEQCPCHAITMIVEPQKVKL